MWIKCSLKQSRDQVWHLSDDSFGLASACLWVVFWWDLTDGLYNAALCWAGSSHSPVPWELAGCPDPGKLRKKLDFFPVPETASPGKEWAQFESQILHSSDDFEFFTSASKKPAPNPTAVKAGLAHCFPGLWLHGGAEGLNPSCPFFYTLTESISRQRAAVPLSLWILTNLEKLVLCTNVANVKMQWDLF